MTSLDVKALFTSVPVDLSIQIVKHKLAQDPSLPQRTSMAIKQIVTFLEFCLKNTYFLFQGKFYEQVQGAPIGPLIYNLFTEEFEVKALSSCPTLWLRFVDDTFVIRQNTTNHFFNTSTTRTLTSNSQLKNHLNRAHFYLWTL